MTLRVPLSRYPGFNKFVLEWVTGEKRATQFLPRSEGTPRRAQARRHIDLVEGIAAFNQRFGSFVKPQLEAWANGETVTIIGGQQVGFAGGPLYTLAKIATMLKAKRDL